MRLVPCLALIAGALSSLSAAEPMWTPFVSIGYAPSVDNVNHSDFNDKGAGKLALGESMNHTYQGEWGCTTHLAVFDTYGKADGDAASVSGVEVKTNTLGLEFGMGPTYHAMPDLLIALVPYVGLGWARYDYSGPNSSTDNGLAFVYGAKIAVCYALHNNVTVGIDAGFEGSTTRLKNDSANIKYTATGAGPAIDLMVGWVF